MPKRTAPPDQTNSKIRRVEKTSISEEIANQIMNLIATEQLKPRQRLPSERELCIAFGASRSSLREAMRCLAIVGVLDAYVGGGTSVAQDGQKFLAKILEWRLISEKHDIENLLEVRIGLEGIAAASVARDHSEATMEKLESLVERMRETLSDPKQFISNDLDFHTAIAEASGNRLLWDMIMMIRTQLAHGMSRVLSLHHAIPLSFDEHKAILQAIGRGDPSAARQAMQAHLNAALLRYRDAAGSAPREKGIPVRRGRGVPRKLTSVTARAKRID
jgi:GntR family transcriptional regulator, transcriptional repressor for pyruvate dehydrogenase complex